MRWALTAAVLALVLVAARTVDWATTWRAMRGASPVLLLGAALVNLLSLLVRGARWWIFLRAAGAASLGLALRGAVVGSGLNNVLAANGGEAARVLFVSRRGGASSATVLAALALDRLVDALSCVALLALAPLVMPLPAALARFRAPAAAALVTLALLALVLVRRGRRDAVTDATTALAGDALPAGPDEPRAAVTTSGARRLRARAHAYAARFATAVTGLLTGRRLAAALLLSLASWTGQAATYHLAALAVGFPASPSQSTAAMLAVNLSFLVQLTPGNVGVVQLLYALVMSAFGLPHNAAVGVAMLLQAVQIVPVTLLALLFAPRMARRR